MTLVTLFAGGWSGVREKYCWLAGGWKLVLERCERKTLLGWRLLELLNRVNDTPFPTKDIE